jgi:hypothetical protein
MKFLAGSKASGDGQPGRDHPGSCLQDDRPIDEPVGSDFADRRDPNRNCHTSRYRPATESIGGRHVVNLRGQLRVASTK